jgi:RND family efflux transporter MFP subunit
MKPWMLVTAAGVAALAATGCVDRNAQMQAKRTASIVTDATPVVDVQPARMETVTDELEITGDITTGEDTTVGAKQSGRITAVYVKEGDTVSAGQLIATLDTSQLMSQLRQALAQVNTASAGLSSATANLAQARRNAAAGPDKSSASLRSAQAQLRSAEAQLKKARSGARPEEIVQAEWAVKNAKTNLDTQQKELERIQRLVAEGAIAGNQLDKQQAVVMAAQTQYEGAQQSLIIAKAGARPEDLETAQESVRQAQEAVNQAKTQKSLDPLLQDQVNAAVAQVSSARSQLEAAQANVSIVQQTIADMQIKAPFSGMVQGKPAQPGTIAGAGTPIVRLIGGGGDYFNGDIPATVVDQVRPGMPVEINVDGIPGKAFSGTIASVSPLGENVGRLFTARVALDGAPAGVKPGMFAHGTIRLRTIQNATVVPVDAVVAQGSAHYVFFVDGNIAHRAAVTTGVQKGIWMQVTGVPAGAKVVVDGQQKLLDGEKVKVKESSASARRETTGEKQS